MSVINKFVVPIGILLFGAGVVLILAAQALIGMMAFTVYLIGGGV